MWAYSCRTGVSVGRRCLKLGKKIELVEELMDDLCRTGIEGKGGAQEGAGAAETENKQRKSEMKARERSLSGNRA